MNWETTFSYWADPPGDTSQDKCEKSVRAVRKAIEASEVLREKNIVVLHQGSYRNRTNVRSDSDVDICVLCKNSLFFDIPQDSRPADYGLSIPAIYPYQSFRTDVDSALRSYFGAGSIKLGDKAFDIHANSYRTDADVVACFPYVRYQSNGYSPQGTAFCTTGGLRIINWPDQNYDNGVTKNNETGRRFKDAVRILKNLRKEMEDANIASAETIKSFTVESLVWNVPAEGFGRGTYTADIRWILAFLFNNTM